MNTERLAFAALLIIFGITFVGFGFLFRPAEHELHGPRRNKGIVSSFGFLLAAAAFAFAGWYFFRR